MYPYQQMYQQQMQYQPQAQQQMQQPQQQMQIQNGGFVPIRDESMVYSYPVEFGKCVTFKVEGKPIVIEKSMGFSQFESPKIERYRLVKEEIKEEIPEEQVDRKTWETELENLHEKIEALEKDIQYLKAKARSTTNKKKEDVKDDPE